MKKCVNKLSIFIISIISFIAISGFNNEVNATNEQENDTLLENQELLLDTELPKDVNDVKESEIELPDGTIADIEITLDPVNSGPSIMLIQDRTYTISVNNGVWNLSFKMDVGTNPVRIENVHTLEYGIIGGTIASANLEIISDSTAQAQIQINLPAGVGSTTRTVQGRLVQGRVMVWYNGNSRIIS